jgi:hypothetical protein
MGPWVATHRSFIRGLLERPAAVVAARTVPDGASAPSRSLAAGLVVWHRMVAACENAAR